MTKLEDIARDLSFNEEKHEYRNKEGKILTSVTSLLHIFQESFDKTGIIAFKCGQREGISKEEMQERWKKKADDACILGTRLHGRVEKFLKEGIIEDSEDKDIIEDFAKIKFKGKIHSELRLTSPTYKLAGTTDIVTLNKKTASVFDLKSNARFDTKSKYYKKLLYPLNHIADCHLTVYSLQILIYGEMIKEHGYKFEPGQILWINPESRKIQPFDVLDLRKEVQTLLDYWQGLDNF